MTDMVHGLCEIIGNIKMGGGDFVGEVIKGVVALEKTESGSNWGWEMSHILCVTECIQKLGGGVCLNEEFAYIQYIQSLKRFHEF